MSTDRSFFATIRFRISGNVPSFIEDEHIVSKIESILEDKGGIALSGEYYFSGDGEEAEQEWEMDIDTDSIRTEICELNYQFTDHPFCEQCGENFKDFALVFADGGTHVCLNCFSSLHDGIFTESEMNQWEEQENKERVKYLKAQLKEAEKQTKKKTSKSRS